MRRTNLAAGLLTGLLALAPPHAAATNDAVHRRTALDVDEACHGLCIFDRRKPGAAPHGFHRENDRRQVFTGASCPPTATGW